MKCINLRAGGWKIQGEKRGYPFLLSSCPGWRCIALDPYDKTLWLMRKERDTLISLCLHQCENKLQVLRPEKLISKLLLAKAEVAWRWERSPWGGETKKTLKMRSLHLHKQLQEF